MLDLRKRYLACFVSFFSTAGKFGLTPHGVQGAWGLMLSII